MRTQSGHFLHVERRPDAGHHTGPVRPHALHNGLHRRAPPPTSHHPGAQVGVRFTISNVVTPPLYPGTSQRLNLVFTNPNPSPITIAPRAVSISVSTSQARCSSPVQNRHDPGPDVQSDDPGQPDQVARWPGHQGQDHWPVVTMVDTHSSQNRLSRCLAHAALSGWCLRMRTSARSIRHDIPGAETPRGSLHERAPARTDPGDHFIRRDAGTAKRRGASAIRQMLPTDLEVPAADHHPPRPRPCWPRSLSIALGLGGGVAYAYLTATGRGPGRPRPATRSTSRSPPRRGLPTSSRAQPVQHFTLTNTGFRLGATFNTTSSVGATAVSQDTANCPSADVSIAQTLPYPFSPPVTVSANTTSGSQPSSTW